MDYIFERVWSKNKTTAMDMMTMQRVATFLPIREIGKLALTNEAAKYTLFRRREVWEYIWLTRLGRDPPDPDDVPDEFTYRCSPQSFVMQKLGLRYYPWYPGRFGIN